MTNEFNTNFTTVITSINPNSCQAPLMRLSQTSRFLKGHRSRIYLFSSAVHVMILQQLLEEDMNMLCLFVDTDHPSKAQEFSSLRPAGYVLHTPQPHDLYVGAVTLRSSYSRDPGYRWCAGIQIFCRDRFSVSCRVYRDDRGMKSHMCTVLVHTYSTSKSSDARLLGT